MKSLRFIFAVPPILALGAIAASACSSEDPVIAESDASAPTDASKRDRFAQDPDATAGQCLRCSMVLGFLTGSGTAPGGPGGGGPPMGDPCDPDAGGGGGPGGGGMGGITFCNEKVFNSFLACVQQTCASSCALPGAGQCDAGRPDASDATDASAAPDAGDACNACLKSRCATELAACTEDK